MSPFDLPLKVLKTLPKPADVSRLLAESAEFANAIGSSVGTELKNRIQRRVHAAEKRDLWASDERVCGLQLGDVGPSSALLWVRLPCAGSLYAEWSLVANFDDCTRIDMPAALDSTDYTARVSLADLPAQSTIYLRVVAQLMESTPPEPWSRSTAFRTAPLAGRKIRFAWSADVGGQGFGINPQQGGMPIFKALADADLDFFVHCGDTVYADHPVAAVFKDERGAEWQSIVTASKSKAAETLAEFRGNYRYNWLDQGFQAFCARVPQVVIWDDHEVTNNWSPSFDIQNDKRYANKNLELLSAHASRAFREYMPVPVDGFDGAGQLYRVVPYGPTLDLFVIDMQSYRGPNCHNLCADANEDDETNFLGQKQVAWLLAALEKSTAAWKVVVAGMPLGVNVPDGVDAQGRVKWQGVANGDDGPPKGREIEIAGLLKGIKDRGLRNIVWLCADVHYTAAHYYDPAKAAFSDFEPFWEFVSGPMHSGSYGPFSADGTFGLQVHYSKASPIRGASPAAGYQFYGEVEIDPDTLGMEVTLRDIQGHKLFVQAIAHSGAEQG
ncbi:alkaline phosphatase D family protein [Rhodoferax sp.]|uniref:alkaline phosphatase D family protein n=1 Tax=Rhodoferax sp. TaxID=50421 RepID=UPI00374DE166